MLLDQTLQSLEWEQFLEYASKEAQCVPARERVLQWRGSDQWAATREQSEILQRETHEMSALLERSVLWGVIQDLMDPAEICEALSRGRVISAEDLKNLRQWFYAFEAWIEIPQDEIKSVLFKKALTQIFNPYDVLRVLSKILTPEGTISEQASPKLAALYSEYRSLKRDIEVRLEQTVRRLSDEGVLQESFSDVRDGRYVVPVKISRQSEVEGAVHEASVSKQTVFIEPREVERLNNRLRQARGEIDEEIYRILEEVSRLLRPLVGEIEASVAIVVHWDAVQARARVGRHYGGKSIEVTEDRHFKISHSAHPLLWWAMKESQIVRNEVELLPMAPTLLITGPNTGGKTVFLKTLGLAGVFARTGFPFPGSDGMVVPFFDQIFVDLGDTQSIEMQISSFSGHILKFKEILEQLTERSLVLIDELNTATDPEEGAAISRAILEALMEKNPIIVATTHDPYLKSLGLQDHRIVNASMEFDERSSAPTYRMVFGVPGRSRALETAERLGLPKAILEKARSYVSKNHQMFDQILGQIQQNLNEAESARRDAVQKKEQLEKLQSEWKKKTHSEFEEVLTRVRQKLRQMVLEGQDEVRRAVQRLGTARTHREADEVRKELAEHLQKNLTNVEKIVDREAPDVAQELKAEETLLKPAESQAIQVGSVVRVLRWKKLGTVTEIRGSQAKVSLTLPGVASVGTPMSMTVAIEDLEQISSAELLSLQAKGGISRTSRLDYEKAGDSIGASIDLRGERFETAMGKLEQYLDRAFRSGVNEVTIIHGLGGGALRDGTKKLLKSLPYVSAERDGGPGQGGLGATVVQFERK